MARPLRIALSGGLYHVTSRGDRREDIYFGVPDRQAWLRLLGEACARFNWVCHAYCQMTNHYHLVVETPEGNLAAGMRQLNGTGHEVLHNHITTMPQTRLSADLTERAGTTSDRR